MCSVATGWDRRSGTCTGPVGLLAGLTLAVFFLDEVSVDENGVSDPSVLLELPSPFRLSNIGSTKLDALIFGRIYSKLLQFLE